MSILERKQHYLFIFISFFSQEYMFNIILELYDECNVKDSNWKCFHHLKRISECVSWAGRTACPQAALTCGAVLPQRRVSLHARSAHGRRTGNGCVKEGETAWVKATFWPEVKSRGAWLMAISESKALLYVQGTQVTPMVRIYPLKNGSKWILFFLKRKDPSKPAITQSGKSSYTYTYQVSNWK